MNELLKKLVRPVNPETQASIDRYQAELEGHREAAEKYEQDRLEYCQRRGELEAQGHELDDKSTAAAHEYRRINSLHHEGRASKSEADEAYKKAIDLQSRQKAVATELETFEDTWGQKEKAHAQHTAPAALLVKWRLAEARHAASMEMYSGVAVEVVAHLYDSRVQATQPGQPVIGMSGFLRELFK
ncbi:MAG: hypothetical protein VB050_18275 [Geobacteraceae bacterium]|nr:hypothetical protein [Geobacteraceae bacterium]